MSPDVSSSGNALYLTCRHHPSIAESFAIAARGEMLLNVPADLAGYFIAAATTAPGRDNYVKSLVKWLDRHARCGGSLDHFTIGYHSPKDHDLPNVDPVTGGVHRAIREARKPPIQVDARGLPIQPPLVPGGES